MMEKFNMSFSGQMMPDTKSPLTGKPQPLKPAAKPGENPNDDPAKKKKRNPYEITF